MCVCVCAAPVTPHWFLPAALCTGPTGTERLRRSRARRWRAGTEGWWCPTALVCQTLSPTTRLQDRCAGRMQVRVCSSPPASVSNHHVSNDLIFFPVLGFLGTKRLECVFPDGTGRRVVHPTLNYPFNMVYYRNHFYYTDWRR